MTIYLSPRQAADPEVTNQLDKQGTAWVEFRPPAYPQRTEQPRN